MTTLTAPSDGQLVEAAREGDDRAFEELYGRYRPSIKAFAGRLTRDPDRADDLTQEVFISALRRLRATDRPIAFRPWIYEIARNACIDEHRRRQRNQEVPIERDGVDGWLDQLSGGPSPEVAVESKQQLQDLTGAFRGLSERHHRIIVLRELEGRSYRQIGDELGMSQAVVESTLFRARRRLGEEFKDLSTGRRCEQVRRIIGTGPGRRLGLRDRRAVSRHVEHCRPCRREALSAGFSLQPPPRRRLEKAAAAIFPVPLLGLLRRSSPIAGYAGSGGFGSGRLVVAAAAALAAGVGGGLITQATPARGVPRAATVAHSARGLADTRAGGPLATGLAAWRSPGVGRSRAAAPARIAPPARAGHPTRLSGTGSSVAPASQSHSDPVPAPAVSGSGPRLSPAQGVSLSPPPSLGGAPAPVSAGASVAGSALRVLRRVPSAPPASSAPPAPPPAAGALGSVVSTATAGLGSRLPSAG